MDNIKISILFIGSGLTLGFSLMVYAHANFATKNAVNSLRENRVEHQQIMREDIRIMKTDIKKILEKI